MGLTENLREKDRIETRGIGGYRSMQLHAINSRTSLHAFKEHYTAIFYESTNVA